MRAAIALVIGVTLVCAGVAWIYRPAGVILAGLGIAAAALFWDDGRGSGRRP